MSERDTQDRSVGASVTVRPFQIRGRFLTALALRMESETADAAFYEALDEQLERTPQFFFEAPLVLDFGRVPGLVERGRIQDLVENLRRRKLLAFGAQNTNAAQRDALRASGLIPVANGRDAPIPADKPGRARRDEKPQAPDNKLITSPVRSGQMVVAERGDLTVVGSVASGAELIAGGNIHVYGTLRGRAMAGVHGDENARIFCQCLDAELLAVTGLYRTSETIEHAVRNRCVQVFLEDERLRMEALI